MGNIDKFFKQKFNKKSKISTHSKVCGLYVYLSFSFFLFKEINSLTQQVILNLLFIKENVSVCVCV